MTELGEDLFILPVPPMFTLRAPHPRADEPVFTIAVRGLIDVHEIHVDFRIPYLAAKLRQNGTRAFAAAQTVIPLCSGDVCIQVTMPQQASLLLRLDQSFDFVRRLHGALVEKLHGTSAKHRSIPHFAARAPQYSSTSGRTETENRQ
jgi:hypothetical protein